MSTSNPSSPVLDYNAGCTQHCCLLDPSHYPRLFAYLSKAIPGKRHISFSHVLHRQQTVERIATKESDVYYQLPSRWPSPLFFLQE